MRTPDHHWYWGTGGPNMSQHDSGHRQLREDTGFPRLMLEKLPHQGLSSPPHSHWKVYFMALGAQTHFTNCSSSLQETRNSINIQPEEDEVYAKIMAISRRAIQDYHTALYNFLYFNCDSIVTSLIKPPRCRWCLFCKAGDLITSSSETIFLPSNRPRLLRASTNRQQEWHPASPWLDQLIAESVSHFDQDA